MVLDFRAWGTAVFVCKITITQFQNLQGSTKFLHFTDEKQPSPRWLHRAWKLLKILVSVQVFWLHDSGLFNHPYNANVELF